MSEERRVLFVCTHNAARSQMGEGLLRSMGGELWKAASAGTVATRVHPLAIEVMAEIGIDISDQRSTTVDEMMDFDPELVVTVCDDARDSCPAFPGRVDRIHWSLKDPSAVDGPQDAQVEAFRTTRDELRKRIRILIGA